MSQEKEWQWDDDDPIEPGWYAVMKTWDPHEGFIPDAAQWDGAQWAWDSNAVVVAFAGPMVDEKEARRWAYEHDPEY